MKTLLIEITAIGRSEAIILHDLENKKSKFIYTSDANFENWVRDQATTFRRKGYRIFNESEIKL